MLKIFVIVGPDDLFAIDAEDLLAGKSKEVVTEAIDETQDIRL